MLCSINQALCHTDKKTFHFVTRYKMNDSGPSSECSQMLAITRRNLPIYPPTFFRIVRWVSQSSFLLKQSFLFARAWSLRSTSDNFIIHSTRRPLLNRFSLQPASTTFFSSPQPRLTRLPPSRYYPHFRLGYPRLFDHIVRRHHLSYPSFSYFCPKKGL